MSPLELVDDCFGDLARELRSSRPVASPKLRERVHALAPRPKRFELNFRVLVPAVAVGALAVSLAVAGGLGVLRGSTGSEPMARHLTQQAGSSLQARVPMPSGGTRTLGSLGSERAALPSASGRLQQYDANLTVRVDNGNDLSKTTQDALRFTRRVGGFVVWARYAAPGAGGNSELALRVPVDHVQAAIAHFSAYGELTSQQVVLKDLQQRVDDLTLRIGRLKAEIAAIQRQLAGTLTPEKRAALEQRLRRDQARVAALTQTKAANVRRANLARIALTIDAKPKAAAGPGRLHRTFHEAGSVLVRELEVLLYALVVLGPLLLLGLAAILVGRTARRRADRRLLERS